MVFVNELAGIRDIPAWMKHAHAKDDWMTFVDVVFPAFLFIAGMSIPFALNNRLKKGDSFWGLQKHILWRTIGLLVLGLFMVNAESSHGGPSTMPISIDLWALLFFACAILVWNVYTFKNKTTVYFLRGSGIAGLIVLALIFRGGNDGTEYLRPRWWGILGLIGWSYLFSCIFYQLFRARVAGLIGVIVFCTAVFIATRYFGWNDYPAKNATHIAIMCSGIIASLIFFDEDKQASTGKRYTQIFIFAVALFIAGFILRPYYQISKIYATPTWGFYCSAICCLLYAFLYWLVDIKGWKRWTSFFRPAASNPLLTYIIPDIIFYLVAFFHLIIPPREWRHGTSGMLWCLFYAILVMYIAAGLNKMKVRLQL